MRQPTFEELKKTIDGKADVIILNESRRTKRQLETALCEKRITKDKEVERVFDFCNFLEDTLFLPPDCQRKIGSFTSGPLKNWSREGQWSLMF
jgi:hypothetical protein